MMTLSDSLHHFPASVIGGLTIAFLLYGYRKYTGKSAVADLPGPKSPSFLIGHLGEIFRTQAGEIDFEWTSKFGNVVRYKAPFGEDRLLISDPKAVQHILQGYRWGQPTESRASTFFVAGPSILYVQGEDHKRHRRIMNPAFGAPEAKALVPVFSEAASVLTNKWKDLLSLSQDEAEGQVFDMTKWVSRATLDAIGHAGFDYNFGAMQNQDNRLANVYHNLFADMFAAPSDKALIRGHLTSFIPIGMMSRLLEYLSKSDPRLARGRESREVAREVASELVREKSKVVAESGSSRRDVMSLLVKANMASQSEKNRLSEEELYAQMLVMFIAGHETTANSLSWSLLELARHPQVQDRLRKEIHDKERQIASEGRSGSGFTAADLDSLPYLNAVLKESMRYHAVAIRLAKMAYADDCLPLSEGIKMTSGKEINEIPVRKGQKVLISIAAYNRSKEVFGEDAHVFRPERWLENDSAESQKGVGTSVGVFANLLTFSGGVRSCIGWRFAVLELQTFLVELVGNFEFSTTPECDNIRREACAVMVPTIEGEVEKGGQCPLKVRCVRE